MQSEIKFEVEQNYKKKYPEFEAIPITIKIGNKIIKTNFYDLNNIVLYLGKLRLSKDKRGITIRKGIGEGELGGYEGTSFKIDKEYVHEFRKKANTILDKIENTYE